MAAWLIALAASALAFAFGGWLAAMWLRSDLARLDRLIEAETAASLPEPRLKALRALAERLHRRVGDGGRGSSWLKRASSDAAIIEGLADAVVVLDSEREVLRTNEAAKRLFGGDLSFLLRHPALRAALEKTRGDPAMVSLTVPPGRELVAKVVPLPAEGEGKAAVVIADRTREGAIERAQSDFIANVSHELRSPLTSLLGFIETLRGAAAEDGEARERFLAIMAEQAERMGRLINDLLQLTRIELTEHEPPQGRVDLAGLIVAVAASFEPRFAASGTLLKLDLAEGVPAVAGDPDQLTQVLHNLIDNALAYGRPQGTVTLGLALAPRGEAVLTVSDDGPGIALEHLPRLTERFYRVDKARSRASGGTGLGLAIVRHIISRHRGQMSIASEPGQGTTVQLWLPAA